MNGHYIKPFNSKSDLIFLSLKYVLVKYKKNMTTFTCFILVLLKPITTTKCAQIKEKLKIPLSVNFILDNPESDM